MSLLSTVRTDLQRNPSPQLPPGGRVCTPALRPLSPRSRDGPPPPLRARTPLPGRAPAARAAALGPGWPRGAGPLLSPELGANRRRGTRPPVALWARRTGCQLALPLAPSRPAPATPWREPRRRERGGLCAAHFRPAGAGPRRRRRAGSDARGRFRYGGSFDSVPRGAPRAACEGPLVQ